MSESFFAAIGVVAPLMLLMAKVLMPVLLWGAFLRMVVVPGVFMPLAGQLVCVTAILYVFTIFLWTFGLRMLGLM